MRLKSYFADTIESAMALANREMGEDALLVYSRPAAPEARYLGNHEVVFAEAEAAAGASPAAAHETPRAQPSRPPGDDPLAWATAALSDLRREIGSLRQDVAAQRRCVEDLAASADRRAWRLLADWSDEPDSLDGLPFAGRLLQSDMDADHVLDVMECARDTVRREAGTDAGGERGQAWRRAIDEQLAARRPADSQFGQPGRRPTILLFGPPGAGKSTTAMQLAAHAAGRGLEPRLVAFEPGRLSAAQPLRSYAAVLGAPFELIRRADRLAELLQSLGSESPVIVDCPGLGAHPDEGARQMTAFLERGLPVEVWLVLPASLRGSDLGVLCRRFAACRPARLLFTHTGEARHWGALWSCAEWANLPLSFFCHGPRIPEDLVAATGAQLAQRLLASGTDGRG